MSVIRKKPYIESVIESLSQKDKEDLLAVLNTPGNNVKSSFLNLPAKGITPVYFQLDSTNLKTGILVYNDSYCALVCYHRFQDLLIYKLDVEDHVYAKVNEYCDINELRRVLDDALDIIDSGDAEENEVLVADGESGSSWKKPAEAIKEDDVESGNAQTILAFDEEGNVVKSSVPSGTVSVDSSLSEISENPVQNKVIKEALDDKVDLDYADETYVKLEDAEETYAKQDGDYAVAGLRAKSAVTAETADQLFATKSVVDKVPYLFRTSGGSADIGNRSSGSIVGGSIVVNQHINPLDFQAIFIENGITWTKNPDGSVSAVGTLTNDYSIFSLSPNYGYDGIAGRKYLVQGCPIGGSPTTYNIIGFAPNWNFREIGSGIIINKPTDLNGLIGLVVDGGIGTTYDLTFHPKMIDLTQALGSTIADYIYDLEVANAGSGIAWFNTHFPNYPLDYNVGTLTYVEGLVSHDMVGFNQYNGDYARVIANNKYCISGAYTDLEFALTEEGAKSAVSITTENGHDYFTPTQNGFVFVNGAGADTCINLSWSGTKDGEYEDYVKHSYPLDNDVILRGIPKLDVNNKLYYDGDIYSSDGKVQRRYALVDLGTLSWTYITAINVFATTVSDMKPHALGSNSNLLSPIYETKKSSYNEDYEAFDKITWCFATLPDIRVKNSAYTDATAFKAAMSGVYLLYEVETPTEENFDPFIYPQIVNDWGTEEFVVDTPLIPVGHDTAYPANLRDKLQNAPDLPSITDDYVVHYEVDGRVATYVLLSTWLTANNYKVNVIPPAPATDGNYTLKVAVVDGVATYSWETI